MLYRASDDVSVVTTEYGSVVLDGVRGCYWQLNETGTVIALRLLDGHEPDEVQRCLTSEYDVPDGQARADVLELLKGMRAAGLLVPREQP